MAEATYTAKDGNTHLNTWSLTSADATGNPVQRPGASDRSVHVFGAFDGATVTIQGTLDGANYATIHDQGGVALTFVQAGILAVSENVLAIRPVLSGGSGSAAVTVHLFSRSTK